MSLDVYLEAPSHSCPTCGQMHGGARLYEANITHNLNTMAEAAGLYDALWHPELVVAGPAIAEQIRAHEAERRWAEADDLRSGHVAHARDLIEPIRAGLQRLRSDPERFKKLNPENGWGSYDGLVRFATNYLAACEEHPDARIEVSR